MFGFSIDSIESQETCEKYGSTYDFSGYASTPSDFRSDKCIVDIEKSQYEMKHRWLDDYGWL